MSKAEYSRNTVFQTTFSARIHCDVHVGLSAVQGWYITVALSAVNCGAAAAGAAAVVAGRQAASMPAISLCQVALFSTALRRMLQVGGPTDTRGGRAGGDTGQKSNKYPHTICKQSHTWPIHACQLVAHLSCPLSSKLCTITINI